MPNNSVFKMPKPVKITGRSSSITNSFVNGIIPVITPTDEQVHEALQVLGMNEDTICCAYCGDRYTEWDHLRPLVINKTATGYISEIHNLVPACGKCNQSKGNQEWKAWMYSDATLSPATRKVVDIVQRAYCLEQYENKWKPIKIDIEAIVGKFKWQQHWDNCEKIQNLMRESQVLSDEIKNTIQQALDSENEEILECFSIEKDKPKTVERDIRVSEYKNSYKSNPEATTINDPRPFGKIVTGSLIPLLQSGNVNDTVISFLQQKEYSKQMFDINFPLLLHIDSIADSRKGVDANGYNRYYAKSIVIRGELYLVCAQWFDRGKTKLIQWIKKYFCV